MLVGGNFCIRFICWLAISPEDYDNNAHYKNLRNSNIFVYISWRLKNVHQGKTVNYYFAIATGACTTQRPYATSNLFVCFLQQISRSPEGVLTYP